MRREESTDSHAKFLNMWKELKRRVVLINVHWSFCLYNFFFSQLFQHNSFNFYFIHLSSWFLYRTWFTLSLFFTNVFFHMHFYMISLFLDVIIIILWIIIFTCNCFCDSFMFMFLNDSFKFTCDFFLDNFFRCFFK